MKVTTHRDLVASQQALDSYLICGHAYRVSKYGAVRVFIWADKDAPVETREAIVKVLQDSGCKPIYFVVVSPTSRQSAIEYKAIPWSKEQ